MQAVMNTDDGIRVVDADEPSGAGYGCRSFPRGSAAPTSTWGHCGSVRSSQVPVMSSFISATSEV